MGDNGKDINKEINNTPPPERGTPVTPTPEPQLIFKVDLRENGFHIEWGKGINPLLYDRAIRLINIEIDKNICLQDIQKKQPIVQVPKHGIMDFIRRGR